MKEFNYHLWICPWDYNINLLETMFKEEGLVFTSLVDKGNEDTLFLEGIIYCFNSREGLELAIVISDNF